MSETLKPCPFCGSTNIETDVFTRDGRKVVCHECRASVTRFNPEANDKAIAGWNKRCALSASLDEGDGSKVIVIGESTIAALRQGKEVGLTNGVFLIPESGLSALSTLAEARAEALEEAAKLADEYECSLADYGGSVDAQKFYEGGMLDAGQGIASAIRSLIPKKEEG